MTFNINLTEKEIEKLKVISENIKTQDNASTQDPVFVVYQLKEVVVDDDYSPYNRAGYDTCCVYKSGDETFLPEEELQEYYNDLEVSVPDLDDLDCLTMGYVDDFVSAFLTRKAAEEYITQNKHNLKKPFIYVESLYRNEEMQLIRKLLQNLI